MAAESSPPFLRYRPLYLQPVHRRCRVGWNRRYALHAADWNHYPIQHESGQTDHVFSQVGGRATLSGGSGCGGCELYLFHPHQRIDSTIGRDRKVRTYRFPSVALPKHSLGPKGWLLVLGALFIGVVLFFLTDTLLALLDDGKDSTSVLEVPSGCHCFFQGD